MSDLCKIEVVPVVLEKHSNADSLSLVKVFDGYVVVVRTDDWLGVNKAAYIPPDNIVPDRPEFAFLDGKFRIKTKRLRGVMSQGLLVPVPDEFNIGDDMTEYFGITRYVPPLDAKIVAGEVGETPLHPGPKYDIESWFKYKSLIEGRFIIITEKIHGTNSRFSYCSRDEKMFVGSRSFYRKESEASIYWKMLTQYPQIKDFCKAHPNVTLYGEIYGWVQTLRYGASPGVHNFKAFDVYDPVIRRFWDWDISKPTLEEFNIPCVPIIAAGVCNDELIEPLINGPSQVPGAPHCREGIVIKPIVEEWCPEIGRLILKAVSPVYLEKS